jgi:hypothetical protein
MVVPPHQDSTQDKKKTGGARRRPEFHLSDDEYKSGTGTEEDRRRWCDCRKKEHGWMIACEVGEIGLCTSSRCPLETGLWSWPTQRRTRHDTAHALATYTGFFSEVCKTGALATLQRRIFASGQRLGGGRVLERIHRPPGGQSTATGRVPL